MAGVASHINHHLAGHFCGDERTMVALDESQGHIDSRGDSGTADDSSVLDEQTVSKNVGGGAEFPQFLDALPVGCTATMVQQSRLRQREGASADRSDDGAPVVGRFKPAHQDRRNTRFPHRESRNDDQVTWRDGWQRAQMIDLQALIGGGMGSNRTVLDAVLRPEGVRLEEGLQWPGKVEDFASVEVDED